MKPTRRNLLVLGLVLLAVVVAGAVLVVIASDDEETTPTSTSTEAGPEVTSTTASSTTSTAPPTASTTRRNVSDEEAATIVWPAPGGDVAYDEPIAAAQGFAEDLVGFGDPLYGEFQQGDSRSGEIEVRTTPGGPTTTVLVRQMSDDLWYVIGAATSDVELTEPVPGSAIDHPLQVSGRVSAAAGQVRVAVYERGDTTPLGEGFVDSSGTAELRTFEGEISWDNPGGGWGSVVVTTALGEGDTDWTAATAIPVGFIGGD